MCFEVFVYIDEILQCTCKCYEPEKQEFLQYVVSLPSGNNKAFVYYCPWLSLLSICPGPAVYTNGCQ